MSHSCLHRRLRAAGLLSLLLGLIACQTDPTPPPSPSSPPPPALRGAWVQDDSIASREAIDDTIRRAEAGGFEAIFANVFVHGYTLYDSVIVPKHPQVEPDFNPLAYLIDQAHRRDIEVHAWFVNGPVAYRGESWILDEHPDWAIVGPDGKTGQWLNFTRPDVRQFLGDLMEESVGRYGVDGLHFDFTRYPSPEWGFDAYSLETFNAQHDFDLNMLRYADLPAYGEFSGRPLIEPASAQVLAIFSNGAPAVTLNAYGRGEVVVLNWNAAERSVAAGSEILQRSLHRLLSGGQVYLLRSETTIAIQGADDYDSNRRWLEDLGWSPLEVDETTIRDLAPGSALVLPNVYDTTPEAAADLADFVQRGGGLVIIGGVGRAIRLDDLQSVTGLRARGDGFSRVELVMTALSQHPLIPISDRLADLQVFQTRDEAWKEFRRQGINTFIGDVYRRIKAQHPEVIISVTITADQDQAARRVLQDWRAWLEGGYIDYLIPRGYVDTLAELDAVIADWGPIMRDNRRVTLGLRSFVGSGGSQTPKSSDQLLAEIEWALAAGSNGIMVFALQDMDDEQLRALSTAFAAPPASH
jgi:uncharacterized lipoprotein YddW (UPF0748 family)